ncbi:MAG TPA: cyclic nucleotide-binding domain-containing protein [Anaerolineales bacterium]
MVDTLARAAFLKKIHLFYGLEDDELAAVAEKLEEQSYPAEGVIFEQDAEAESFYLIYKGSVRIMRRERGREIQLALLVKNDYFGEMALAAKRRRSGTVTALTDTRVLVLSRKDFEGLYKQAPQLRLNLEVALRSRILARTLQFKWLRSDEVIYFLARKHPFVLFERLILPIFALSVPGGLFYGWIFILDFFLVGLAAWASLIAIVLFIIWLVIDWGNDYYIVTNQRVIWLEKVIGIYESRQESPLSTILSVNVETGQLGRIFDYGHVIVRTWVGKIPFSNVSHPEQAQHMIEEYWHRTQDTGREVEKEAMKEAIRRKLGIASSPKPESPPQTSPAPASTKKKSASSQSDKKRKSLLRLLGANTLKLRYETGETVIYRKHWFVLFQQAWMPLGSVLAAIVIFFWRQYQLFRLPDEAFVRIVNGSLVVDAFSLAIMIAFFPLFGWLLYEVVDWSNDQFQVTPEQIIDLDKKPFGTESRSAAQLENILGTEYRRIGILGEIFNYGTVYITVGGSKLAFEDVMDPATVQSDIDRRRMARKAKQDEARNTAERERMADWLATYHRNVEQFRDEERRNPNSE